MEGCWFIVAGESLIEHASVNNYPGARGERSCARKMPKKLKAPAALVQKNGGSREDASDDESQPLGLFAALSKEMLPWKESL
jgi:hypothetical protein